MQEIDLDEFINRFKQRLNDYQDCNYAFFLGAGASISANIPSAGELVKKWLPQLHQLKHSTEAGWEQWAHEHYPDWDNNPAAHYATVMQTLFPLEEERQREIENIVETGKPGFAYATLASLMTHKKLGRQTNVILTTNFDDLVADALYLYTNQKPLMIGHNALANFIRPSQKRPLVIKLHGDAKLAPKNTDGETQKIDQQTTDAVHGLLQETGLIFSGYGGNDESITKLLKELPSNSLHWGIFWLNAEKPANPELQKWLEERNAVWVKHNNFDELMMRVFDASKLENPLEDLTNRIDQLKKTYKASFDEYSTASDEKRSESTAKALKRTEETLDWWDYQQEINRYEKNDPEKADRLYQYAIAKLPNAHELIGNYASFLHTIVNNHDKAEIFYQLAITIAPTHSIILDNYANLLTGIRKDYNQAESFYQRAIEADPTYANSLGNYAKLLFTLSRSTDAEQHIDLAFAQNPTRTDLLCELWFYRYAHQPIQQQTALIELHKLLTKDARSPGWDLSQNVEKAIADDHPEPELLQQLAKVIADEADISTLDAFPTWQALSLQEHPSISSG